jgi:hypothetical protein
MKLQFRNSIVLTTTLLAFGCSSVPTASQIQALAGTALSLYNQYNQYKSGQIPSSQVPTVVAADISGIAALAQAYSGSGLTPAQANIAQGAANPIPATQLVAAMPNTPITQTTVNTLYAVAAAVPAK